MRYYIVLPEPIPVPDGFKHLSLISGPTGQEPPEDTPFVDLTFHQVEVTGGREAAALKARYRVSRRARDLPRARFPWRPSSRIRTPFTVVEAVTTFESPEDIPEADIDHPRRWTPRNDSFTRCIHSINEVLLAYKHAADATHGLLTYVRLPLLVVYATAVAKRTAISHEDGTSIGTYRTSEWQTQIMQLDHRNLSDPYPTAEWNGAVAERFDYWLHEPNRRNPLTLWRERFIDARRALHRTGDLTTAVLMANTSCEVLIDTALALLMWEEKENPASVAPAFEHGKVLRRITKELTPRLGGNWSTQSGPVGDWYTHCYRLRHRIIHAGHTPTEAEAEAAVNAAYGLQNFLWERLVAKRTNYPRATLMTIAQEGLEKRHLWNAQIKRFAEQVAETEPNWRDAYTNFYAELVSEMSRQDSGT